MRRHSLPRVPDWTPLLASWPAHQLPRVNVHCMFDTLHCVSFHTRHGSRPLAPNHTLASTGIQTIRSLPLVSKPYARVTGFEPYAHSHVYWYLTIHELLRPLVSNCTQYVPASTDSLIRHRSLLLCRVSSAACVAGSFISGAQLALTVLRAEKPFGAFAQTLTPAMYMP